MENNISRILHYIVEIVCAILIACIAFAYMTVGCYETPVILGAIGAIAGIAAWDIHKRGQNNIK